MEDVGQYLLEKVWRQSKSQHYQMLENEQVRVMTMLPLNSIRSTQQLLHQTDLSSCTLYVCWWCPCLFSKKHKEKDTKSRILLHPFFSVGGFYGTSLGNSLHGGGSGFLVCSQVHSLPFSAWLCFRRLTPVDWVTQVPYLASLLFSSKSQWEEETGGRERAGCSFLGTFCFNTRFWQWLQPGDPSANSPSSPGLG